MTLAPPLALGAAALAAAVALAVVALVQGRRLARLRTEVEALRRARERDEVAEAAEHLKSSERAARVTGICLLERIGRDLPEHRAAVAEILAAFVRDRAPLRPGGGPPSSVRPRDSLHPAADVQAALTALGRRERTPEEDLGEGLDLRRTDLTGADLREARLTRADLEETVLRSARLEDARLEGARMTRADLAGAYLGGARLEEAQLGGARLTGAFLGRADLGGAFLVEANLEGAFLGKASLEGAHLKRARLAGAKLGEAKLEGAYLREADLTGANLLGADLRGAVLVNAVGLEPRQLEGAKTDASTVLADDGAKRTESPAPTGG
jgi:uncharacterized protein YjbI with pentapeptide repeats